MFTTNIYIKGFIKDIQFSHDCNNKKYLKAFIQIDENNSIPIKFREDLFCSSNIKEQDYISIQGTIRTYSKFIYVYTNLQPVDVDDEMNCLCSITGKIVKKDVKYSSYIVQKDANTFIPLKSDKDYGIGQDIKVSGYLIQRQYTKKNNLNKFITYEVIER